MNQPKSGLGLIVLARDKQLAKGYTITNDAKYPSSKTFQMAAFAILTNDWRNWPEHEIPISVWEHIYATDTRREQLAIAGAFIAAAIDRLAILDLLKHLDAAISDISAKVVVPMENEIRSIAEYTRWAECGSSNPNVDSKGNMKLSGPDYQSALADTLESLQQLIT